MVLAQLNVPDFADFPWELLPVGRSECRVVWEWDQRDWRRMRGMFFTNRICRSYDVDVSTGNGLPTIR